MNGVDLQLPPGFRFHPTDEELVLHYLCRKCTTMPITVPIIADVDIYKHDPWLLPGMASYGDKEWYFFSSRDRKYPNGSRPNRSAGSGYWKATGADKPVGSPRPVGIKKALVFYTGKAPKGVKTNWIMHEYRLPNIDNSARRKTGLRLDDWVLCRIYNKGAPAEMRGLETGQKLAVRASNLEPTEIQERKPVPMAWHVQESTGLNLWSLESMPRLHHAESSCSEHALSPELVKCERSEVASQPWLGSSWENLAYNNLNNGNSSRNIGGVEFFSDFGSDQLQDDIFMFQGKPF